MDEGLFIAAPRSDCLQIVVAEDLRRDDGCLRFTESRKEEKVGRRQETVCQKRDTRTRLDSKARDKMESQIEHWRIQGKRWGRIR